MKSIIKTILTITMISQLSISAFAAEVKQNTEKIKIDIVSDVVCPWCAIGFKRLSVAISELKLENQVEISWHPFELNPEMPREGQNADKYLMNKYNLSEEKLKQTRNNMTQLGKETGFKFDYFKENNPPILEIVKGPKNKFINQEIKIFLANNGFYNVNIKSSKSSYR